MYIMIVVDDFTRFTWAILLRFKSKAPSQLETLCRRLQNEKGLIINCLQSDHGRELRTLNWNNFVMRQEWLKNFLLQSVLNKME